MRIHSSLMLSILLFNMLIFVNPIKGQQKQDEKFFKKNAIRFFVEPALTKSNINLSETTFPLNSWYISKRPSKFLENIFYGIEYSRFFQEKHNISLSFRHTQKGQQSPIFFNNSSGDTDPNNYPSGYGGKSYEIRIISDEITISYGHLIFKNKNLFFILKSGISLDIFNKATIQDFIIENENGIKRRGCCISTIYTGGRGYLDQRFQSIKDKKLRIGIILSSSINYNIYKSIYINVQPEIGIYSKSMTDNLDSITRGAIYKGSILILGTQLGIGYRF